MRFWVPVDGGEAVAASVGAASLHYRFESGGRSADPLALYAAHAAQLHAAVRQRLSGGAREPVMLRDADF